MALVRYLTHPQVRIDPTIAVTEWQLSNGGYNRVVALVARNPFAGTVAVISSDERKALETAAPIAASLGLDTEVAAEMHENDRNATGYLPIADFEVLADRFFAHPEENVEGWESAANAQIRIVAATKNALEWVPEGDILLVGHGGVGTLLWCALSNLPISREHDQPGAEGGNCFSFDRETGVPICGWTPLERL